MGEKSISIAVDDFSSLNHHDDEECDHVPTTLINDMSQNHSFAMSNSTSNHKVRISAKSPSIQEFYPDPIDTTKTTKYARDEESETGLNTLSPSVQRKGT
jgi:hypothetical protein